MEVSQLHIADLHIDNYKSLKNSSVDFRPGLNIIIGKNGAGKSNLLSFIYRYATRNIFNLSIRGHQTNFSISYQYLEGKIDNRLSITVERTKIENSGLRQPRFAHEWTINKIENLKVTIQDKKITTIPNKPSKQGEENISREIGLIRNFNRAYVRFEIPDESYFVSKPNRLVIDEENNPSFEEPFFLSFSLFEDLTFKIEFEISAGRIPITELKKDVNSLKVFFDIYLKTFLDEKLINQYLQAYTPITEIRFNPNLNVYIKEDESTVIIENFLVDFLIEGDWLPWSYLSDGTKRLFYLISEIIEIKQGLILVEEPELGIHPHQLLKVLEFLKEQSNQKQIIISTHSPLALDILREDELNRITIAKYEKGTKFYKLTRSEISKAKKYIREVGELSYYWLHSDLEK